MRLAPAILKLTNMYPRTLNLCINNVFTVHLQLPMIVFLPFSNEKSIFLVTIFEFYFTAKVVERRMQKPCGVEFYVYDLRPVHR